MYNQANREDILHVGAYPCGFWGNYKIYLLYVSMDCTTYASYVCRFIQQ